MGSLTVNYIGYDGSKSDCKTIRIEEFSAPVPSPTDDEILVHVTNSGINPVDWKLAIYNFFGRKDKVSLGFDVAGKAVQVGKDVSHIKEGDDVIAYGYLVNNGVWSAGGKGSYQVVNKNLVVKRDPRVPAEIGGVLGVAYLSAHDGITPNLKENDRVYIPGGAGGVAHYSIQLAKTYKGVDVISSASRSESEQIAKQAGARAIINYKQENVPDAVKKAFNGQLATFVYDTTYIPSSHVSSAQSLADNGTLAILGDLPDEKNSEFQSVAKEKNIKVVQADLIRYFLNPEYVKKRNAGWLKQGFEIFQRLYIEGKIKPFITKTINAKVEEIQHELEANKNGNGLGKVAVRLVY